MQPMSYAHSFHIRSIVLCCFAFALFRSLSLSLSRFIHIYFINTISRLIIYWVLCTNAIMFLLLFALERHGTAIIFLHSAVILVVARIWLICSLLIHSFYFVLHCSMTMDHIFSMISNVSWFFKLFTNLGIAISCCVCVFLFCLNAIEIKFNPFMGISIR